MPLTVADVNAVVEKLWPIAGAEPWDAPGIISGDLLAPVSSILLAVDAVALTADEAVDMGADLLLVHHPLLLRGVTSVASNTYKGSVVSRLIKAECALIAAHTNADVESRGTSAILADYLGLRGQVPIEPGLDPELGIGRVGRLSAPVTLGALAGMLATLLPATAGGIRVSGSFDAPVEVVAVCGGAGDSLLDSEAVLSSDVYITSDLRHHPASEFRENAMVSGGPSLIDISHWASEWLWLDVAAEQLRNALPGVKVTVSELRTDPWDFAVVQ
ncbi:MAG: Nif3-like dinuclear metal center hexameric protein [Microbacteriaceae bacterium]